MALQAPDFLYRWLEKNVTADAFADGDAVMLSDLALEDVEAAGFDPAAIADELGADVVTIVHDNIEHRSGGT